VIWRVVRGLGDGILRLWWRVCGDGRRELDGLWGWGWKGEWRRRKVGDGMSVILDVELGWWVGIDGIGELKGGKFGVSRYMVLLRGRNHGILTCKHGFGGEYLVLAVVVVW